MTRIITTIGLAAFVLFAIWYLPTFHIQTFVLLAATIGIYEYANLVFKEESPRLVTMILGFGLALLMTLFPSQEIMLGGISAVVFVAFLWGLKKTEPLPKIISRVGLIVLGVCYLSLTLPCWGWIHGFGKQWVMLLLFPNALTDTFGFLVGKAFGRRKLAPVVSPNKTWEGFFGCIFGGIFGVWLAQKLFFTSPVLSWIEIIVLGAGISLLAVFGDLIESLIKRSVGVKDSSNLIPGHGGALDRLDALIFTAPFFYLLLKHGVI